MVDKGWRTNTSQVRSSSSGGEEGKEKKTEKTGAVEILGESEILCKEKRRCSVSPVQLVQSNALKEGERDVHDPLQRFVGCLVAWLLGCLDAFAC